MISRPEEIAAAVRERGYALNTDVKEAAEIASGMNSALAHAIVGDLIQLLEKTDEYQLADAEAAYTRAVEIDREFAEGYTSLGFFYDAVLDDPERALRFFEKAIELADSEALEGLRSVLEQLRG